MANDQTDLAPGVRHSEALADASKQARAVEVEVTKALVGGAVGALALSAGFLLGEKRAPFPMSSIWELKLAWGLLFASVVVALINWGVV